MGYKRVRVWIWGGANPVNELQTVIVIILVVSSCNLKQCLIGHGIINIPEFVHGFRNGTVKKKYIK